MTEWTIDRICALTQRPETLNALHACRVGHPWNKTALKPWRSAAFMLRAHPSYEMPTTAIDWLNAQSVAHGE